jgi:hypothetical protein
MSLNIEAAWSWPLELRLARSGMIYECADLEAIPIEPGVYVFGREHGYSVAPLYIGQALNLRRRIDQQLNSVRLMKGIYEAPRGTRFLIYCVPRLKPGQKARKVIGIMENAIIAYALSEDFELLQKQGTMTPNHTISFAGNRTSQAIAPRRMRVAT